RDDREKEIKNFEKTVERLLNTITIDNERSNILREFGIVNNQLHIKKVELTWGIDAKSNFDSLKCDVHKLVLSNNYDEKLMWKEVYIVNGRINVIP
ncbi:11016_t:CDS:2, partial [Scutellospora calospora]